MNKELGVIQAAMRLTAKGVRSAMGGSARVFEFADGSGAVIDVAFVPGEHHARLMTFVAELMNTPPVSGEWKACSDPAAN